MSNQQEDWVSQSKHFARIPLEILSADLTLNELELFIALASFARRDGSLGIFTKCQKTLGEVLGWVTKSTGEGNNKRVSDALALLKEKGLVTTKPRRGINKGIDYQLHLPKHLDLRPTIDRTTPKYLALADAKRQAVKEVYRVKTQKELDRRLRGYEFKPEDGVSDFEELPEYEETPANSFSDDIETIPNSASVVHGFDDMTVDLYELEFSKSSPDHFALLADSIILKNLLAISDEEFKQRLLNVISDRYPDFIDLEPPEKNEAFIKVFRVLNRHS